MFTMIQEGGVRHPRHDTPPCLSALSGPSLSRRYVIFCASITLPRARDPSAFIQNEYFATILQRDVSDAALWRIAILDIFELLGHSRRG